MPGQKTNVEYVEPAEAVEATAFTGGGAQGGTDLFSMIDRNHDGSITRAELMGAFSGGSGMPDGGAAPGGYLPPAPAVYMPPAPMPPAPMPASSYGGGGGGGMDLFSMLDQTHDGGITRTELMQAFQ